MEKQRNLRRGFGVGVATLAGVSAAALCVVGISEHADLAAQRDVALISAADGAHQDLVVAQVGLGHNQFPDDVGLQQNIYSWALEPMADGGLGLSDDSLLLPGAAEGPADSLFNAAFSRFAEANLVGQALTQAQLDHLLGVGQAPDVGGDETLIGQQLFDDLNGAGSAWEPILGDDWASLIDPEALTSAGGFQDALFTWQGDLAQTAWSELFGMFSDVTLNGS